MVTEELMHSYLIPIYGLSLHGISELSIGQMVLKALHADDIQRMAEQHIQALLETVAEEEQEGMIQSYRQFIFGSLDQAKACIVYPISADTREAFDIAFEDATHLTNLIRYALAHCPQPQGTLDTNPPSELHYFVGLEPLWAYPRVYTVPVSVAGDDVWKVRIKPYWMKRPVIITPEIVQTFEQSGFFRLAFTLGRCDRSAFDELIMRGVHWLASSDIVLHPQTRLVNLVTALEVLLGPDDNMERIATTIAESTALLIASNIDERRNIKRKVKGYYNLRSKAVHGGRCQYLSADIIREITDIVSKVIKALIFRNDMFQTKKDLLDWIEGKRLSADIE